MRQFCISALALFVLGTSPAFADSAVPAQPLPGRSVLHKSPGMSKASTALVRVDREYRAHVAQGRPTAFVPSDRFLPYHQGRVLIDARASSDGATLLSDLGRLGLRHGTRHGDLVSGLLPVAAIEQAVGLSSLQSISASLAPIRNAGSINSQGDISLRSASARSTYGIDGSGVTVGVISDSFDTLGGAAADVVSGDLPPTGVQVVGGESPYCGTVIFCTDEGRAMLQIVHDMAPGAALQFHTGMASKADYANAITGLAAAGADVIVDDLLYLNEPMFQDGIVAQAVDAVVAGGTAYYSAAGNSGKKGYEGPFVDSGVVFCIEFFEPIGDCDPIYERVGRMHDFDPGPGVDLYQSITVPEDGVLTIALQWDEPFGGAGPRSDHDILLLDETGGIFYEISANDNVTTREGWEVLQFQNAEVLYYGTSFNIVITYDDVDSNGPPAKLMKMVVFGSSGITLNEYAPGSATLFGHVNAAGATAVGAAFYLDTPEYGVAPPALQPYSALGGTPILFSTSGARLAAPIVRSKPEITAVDGVNTTFFFDDSYGNDGIDDFFGTSAAAPHAAGIAALMLEARPGSTPQQLKSAVETTAIDMNAAGFDHESGFGLIQADAAIAALLAAGGNSPPAADFDVEINGQDVTFTDSSSDVDGTVMSRSWDFGDGSTATGLSPSHTYASDGIYTVELTVTDDDGAVDSTSRQVTIGSNEANAPPVPAFSYTCNGRDCSFDASASTDDAGIVGYAWDFGDGDGSSLSAPTHTYVATGSYSVELTVIDADSATGTATASFRIKNRGITSGTAGGDTGGGGTGSGSVEAEKGRKKCSDGIDNDGDGLIDGADPDC